MIRHYSSHLLLHVQPTAFDLVLNTALELFSHSLSHIQASGLFHPHTPVLELMTSKQQVSANGFVFTACNRTSYPAHKFHFSTDAPSANVGMKASGD